MGHPSIPQALLAAAVALEFAVASATTAELEGIADAILGDESCEYGDALDQETVSLCHAGLEDSQYQPVHGQDGVLEYVDWFLDGDCTAVDWT